MKAFLVAVLLGLATLPAIAQESCVTPAMIAADVAKVPNAKEMMALRDIDIGFEELADVTIWGDGSGHYLSVAFIHGCYFGNQIMDDETVAEFINSHTKQAL
jgi:hypothetical protein